MTLASCSKGGTQKKKEEKYARKRLFFGANPPCVVPPYRAHYPSLAYYPILSNRRTSSPTLKKEKCAARIFQASFPTNQLPLKEINQLPLKQPDTLACATNYCSGLLLARLLSGSTWPLPLDSGLALAFFDSSMRSFHLSIFSAFSHEMRVMGRPTQFTKYCFVPRR
jgi:hypothetical protein